MIRALLASLVCLVAVDLAAAEGDATPSVAVETATLASRSVSRTIDAYGAVEPDPDALVVVALPRAGAVSRVHVRLGERVGAGDALLVLDTAPGTRMQFMQAQAARQYAAGQLERTRALFAEQLATRDQVASAERALRDADAALAALENVGADRGQQTIRADADGIVTSLLVNAGDRVAADTPALILARARGLIVRLGIEPEDARLVPPASPVELISVFQNDIRVDARLEKINAMINPSTRLVDGIVPIPESAAELVTLGATMRAAIHLAEETVAIVPRSAVLRDDKGAYVFAVENGHARRVAVTVTYESSTETGIDSDLGEGAVVVSTGNYELSDGMAVRIDGGR